MTLKLYGIRGGDEPEPAGVVLPDGVSPAAACPDAMGVVLIEHTFQRPDWAPGLKPGDDPPIPPEERTSWPDVIQYEIIEGPCAGQIVDYPPNYITHPHPDPLELARERGWMGEGVHTRPGCAYRSIVHDRERHEELAKQGDLYTDRHLGIVHRRTDARLAPGAN